MVHARHPSHRLTHITLILKCDSKLSPKMVHARHPSPRFTHISLDLELSPEGAMLGAPVVQLPDAQAHLRYLLEVVQVAF
jgi:hypothetical protein